jgi:hypothetical protein
VSECSAFRTDRPMRETYSKSLSNTGDLRIDIQGVEMSHSGLSVAYMDLARLEKLLRELADQEPDGFIKWGTAEGEASHARHALETAASRPELLPDSATALAEDEIAPAVDQIAQKLIDAADLAADPADKFACLQAALHVGRLRDALG